MMHNAVRLLIVSLSCVTLSGCTDLSPVLAIRDDAVSARDAIAERTTALESVRNSLPEDAPEIPALDAMTHAARQSLGTIDDAVARLDAALDEAADPTDGLTHAAQMIGSVVPAPFGAPVLLAGALAATLLRARSLKTGALSIATSLEKAMSADASIRDALAKQADTLRTIQTPTAKKLVDLAQRRPAWSLPV